MVGSVGMVRGISRPGSLVIQEALNLLSALGGDKKGTTQKLLTEMKIVQDHNGVVLADAKEAVVKADKREAEVVEKEAELAHELKRAEELYRLQLTDITNGEVELQRKVDNAAVHISEEDERIRKREDGLHQDHEEFKEYIRVSKEELVERERILQEDRESLKELELSFEGREEKIESDMVVLEDLRSSLGKTKLELDERDARVLAAMGGGAVVGGE